MDFNSQKPIYLQIADKVCDSILSGQLKGEDRVPSVREYGAESGVNPNTVMRSWERLTDDGIIYNKRGIGYFVCPDAYETILKTRREEFLHTDVPAIRERMRLLGLGPEIFK